jgi:hypothetical protein
MASSLVVAGQRILYYLQTHIYASSLDERRILQVGAQVFLQVVWFAGFAVCGHAPSRGKRDYPCETREHVFCEQYG